MHRVVIEPDQSVTLYVGAENWPMPISIVKNGNGAWYFDTETGKKEVLYRRIGTNENDALASMDMQLERNGMKRSLNPTDIRTAPVRRAGRQSFNRSKAATSFKATLSVWKKPMTEVWDNLACFTTATPPCRWVMCTPTLHALAD
jgi:hypothetical protein